MCAVRHAYDLADDVSAEVKLIRLNKQLHPKEKDKPPKLFF
jgi:hypothetical protein